MQLCKSRTRGLCSLTFESFPALLNSWIELGSFGELRSTLSEVLRESETINIDYLSLKMNTAIKSISTNWQWQMIEEMIPSSLYSSLVCEEGSLGNIFLTLVTNVSFSQDSPYHIILMKWHFVVLSPLFIVFLKYTDSFS